MNLFRCGGNGDFTWLYDGSGWKQDNKTGEVVSTSSTSFTDENVKYYYAGNNGQRKITAMRDLDIAVYGASKRVAVARQKFRANEVVIDSTGLALGATHWVIYN